LVDERELPLPELVSACQAETAKYLRGEPSRTAFCWEIFRRAVCERDQGAWEALFEQYRRLLIAWLRQHPAAARLGGDDEHWLTAAFERFFVSVGPERFGIFTDLGQILRYLKMCLNSAVMDEARALGRTRHEQVSEHEPDRVATSDPHAIVVARQEHERLWRDVLAACKSEAERAVALYCWKYGLKPAEVQARRPDLFPTVKEVYTTLRNLKDRLKRNPDIQKYLD
jgi:hypothetical protein